MRPDGRRPRRRTPGPTLFDHDRSGPSDSSPPSPPPTGAAPIDDAPAPLYVQAQGARIGSRGHRLLVEHAGESIAVPARDLCHVVLCGGVSITSGAVAMLSRRGLPIVHASSQGMPRAITTPLASGRGLLRRRQCVQTSDPARRLDMSRRIVAAKIALQATLLRRNAVPRPGKTLRRMKELAAASAEAADLPALRGLEGMSARLYFGRFDRMLRGEEPLLQTMRGRNRRPPRDPINAMLSFSYALLLADARIAVQVVGLEPAWGFLHEERAGRPALALDLMEEFRSLVADSAVVSAINRGMIRAADFERRDGACLLTASGRKAMIRAYEQRMGQWCTPPSGGSRRSLRAVMHAQATSIRAWISGETDGHTPMASR